MASFKVALVALDGQTLPDWVVAKMEEEWIDFVVKECTTQEELSQYAGDADVVWVFGGSRIVTAESLALIPRCGAIIRTGSGTDNIPVAEATELGIIVANTPEALSDAVSDHAIGLLFAVVRQIAVQDRAVRGGIWDRQRASPRWRVSGQTLGLIGFGHIARLVARKMQGFEMRILAYDPYVSPEEMVRQGVHPVSLNEVLSQSDFVSLHSPLTDETYHMIGERELRSMKPTAVLINTSRGPVIDEPALVRALSEGWIAAAGLDVLEREPASPENPLLALDNVVITPHIAAYSADYLNASWRLSVETAVAFAHGRRPRSCVNPNVKSRWRLL
jgi:D-3-phosphoglycerate dehydrogenase